ncbi:nuclear transport factor 2 family protein [Actinomadura kijaniata]|uniref:SnoaL-like domain-containing protein n=1 Tax=Actinomadura namibiensis TaxID=182080 RepID=A0A7W3QJY5_ACTNM|nr:nuclear transport factor 2 family protein [Actinomadura namibiensis]MBA8949841.1 hypothetical protein [Actinomadura namibiensis]
MRTVDRFRAAVDKGDLDALPELFAEDVKFYSPVKFTPFEGREMVMGLFGVLLRTFRDFRYVGELEGTAELAAGGEAPSHILIFRADVDGRQIHGIDLIQVDGDDRITEFTVMVRPQSAVVALGEAVLRGLVEDGLVEG